MIQIFIISLILLTLIGLLIYFQHKNFKQILLEKDLQYQKLLSQKKSSEIVLGQVTEQLVPFLKHFKHDPQKAVFIGKPIDYLVFEDDKIVFIEVKSGHSKLSSKQRNIRKLVKNKKVEWEQIDIKPIIKSERIQK